MKSTHLQETFSNVDDVINQYCYPLLYSISNSQKQTSINKAKHLNLVKVDYYRTLIEISKCIRTLANHTNFTNGNNQQIKILEQNKRKLDAEYINVVKLMEEQFLKWEKYQNDAKHELTSQIKNIHSELNQLCFDDINKQKQKQKQINGILVKSEPDNNKRPLQVDKLECQHCGFETHIASELTSHWLKQHTQEITSSVPGLEPLDTQNIVSSNKNTLDNIDFISCKICHKTFETKFSALLHFDVHARDVCNVCNIEYGAGITDGQREKRCYDKHEFILNKLDKLTKLTCKYCPFTTRIQNNFIHHQLSHNNASHGCQHCSHTTKTKQQLRIHLRCHTNERPFGCKECGKKFTVKSSLRSHMINVHENKREYKCPYSGCCRAFNSNYKLKQHLYTHTGEKPYKCTYCAEMFGGSSRKSRHEKNVHIGWKCRHCDCKFDTESLLKHHREKMHPTTDFRKYKGQNWFAYGCERCEERFKTKEEADVHERKCDEELDGDNELDKILKRKTKRSIKKVNNVNDKKNKKRRRARDNVTDGSKDEPTRKRRKIMIKFKRSKCKSDVDQ